MSQRLKFVDIARALCVIWIVCIWHMNQYLLDGNKLFPSGSYTREVALTITDGVLALFTLISGYFMSRKDVSDKEGVFIFYKKRLLRFEIPLFVSCVLLIFIGRYLTVYQVFTTCFGVAGLLPLPFPKTLWYFSMIILFYIFTPLILYLRKQRSLYFSIVVCLVVYLIFYIGARYLWFDERLMEYWPFYSIPLMLPKQKNMLLLFSNKWHYILTFALCIFAIYWVTNSFSMLFFRGGAIILSNSLICFLLLSISTIIEKIKPLSYLFCMVSFASMFAYLFHREVYITSTIFVGQYNYLYASFWAIFLFFMSYWMQYVYNKYSKIIFK